MAAPRASIKRAASPTSATLAPPEKKANLTSATGPSQEQSDDTPASTKALNILELHEAILLELPVKRLFIAQGVSKTWQDAIKKSPSLQKKMFLLAEGPALRIEDFPWPANTKIRISPALTARCRDCTPRGVGFRRHRIRRHHDREDRPSRSDGAGGIRLGAR